MALFARKDIEAGNLRVRAGQMLPSRFQNSTFTALQLRKDLGKDAIVDIDHMTEGYVVIECKQLDAMRSELEALRKENERLKADAAKFGDKRGKAN